MAHRLSVGILGLGRMGAQIARRLHKNNINVIAWNRSPGPREEFSAIGGLTAESPTELIEKLSAAGSPKIVWLMLPAGGLVDEFLFGPKALSLSKGDVVIDGGNSFYRDSQRRAKKLAENGIHFFVIEPIFRVLAAGNGNSYGLVGKTGAGHFVKMVHNAIEYGMMEAIAEGFGVLRASEFKDLDFSQIAHIWSKGSVVSSWLVDLAKNIFDTENLDNVVGYIHHTGEGKWTIDEAKRLGVSVPVMEDSFRVRMESEKPENQEIFSNKIVALLRKQFGGHEVKYK